MASQAQIDANRLNAQLSTGPKTEEGKQRSSGNSFKHGFYAKSLLVRPDEQQDFDALENRLRSEIMPEEALSEDLFAQLLHAAWNLHRIRRLENQIFVDSLDPFADPDAARRLDALARHRVRFERSYKSALQLLRQHISNRCATFGLPYEAQEAIPHLVDISYIHKIRRGMKYYGAEDFLSPEEREKKQAERAERERRNAEWARRNEQEMVRRGFVPVPVHPAGARVGV